MSTCRSQWFSWISMVSPRTPPAGWCTSSGVCDWNHGNEWAIHITPTGATLKPWCVQPKNCGINYIYTHINYIHAYEHKHISTWQNNRYTRKLIVTSISFFASYGWPPGRGRSFEVGTSKLRLFAKVGLRMGLAITSGFVGGFNMFQPKNHLILTGKSFSQTSNLQFFRFHVNV